MYWTESFLTWEAKHSAPGKVESLIHWTQDHGEVPVFCVVLYLTFIFYFPKLLTKPIKLKFLFTMWNLVLSLFSILGASRVVPHLLEAINDPKNGATFWERCKWTMCSDPKDWYLNGPSGLWVAIFIYSKFPELMDTAFLVLQKKKVIFLHWFHHCTVLLYCWHAFHMCIGPGIWFAAMNYSVHSIMYFYYFIASMGLRWLVRPFAPLITSIQIIQMVGGLVVTITAAMEHSEGGKEQCYTDAANYKMGLGMYFSYFCLFSVLFWNLYVDSKIRKLSEEDKIKERFLGPACDVGDAAGMFHGKNERSKTVSKKDQ